MAVVTQRNRFGMCLTLALALAPAATRAAGTTPTVEQALKLTPVQADVPYDKPAAKDAARATLKAETIGGHSGWVVRDSSGQVLRQFVDSNGDDVVDLWCYFADGIEVYRDIDANFNGKADQFRWLNTAGGRWGLDGDEDGKVDTWKTISAEEVSSELVAALAQHDSRRFARLLLTDKELNQLGLGVKKAKLIRDKIEAATAIFKDLAPRQKTVTAKSQWVQFGGTRPGSVPAGSDGSTKDLLVYENALALVETDGKHSQLPIGTLVQVGDAWRLVDAPALGEDQADVVAGGIFFAVLSRGITTSDGTGGGGLGSDAKTQEMLARLESLDQAAAKATSPEDQAANAAERCDLLEKIAGSVENRDDRAQWLRNLTETLAVAVQMGTYPEGAQRLRSLYEKLEKEADDKDLAAYARFRYLTADYNLQLQPDNADFAKIQKEWLENLEAFVADYPNAAETPEAMLQAGNTLEFSGDEAGAKRWYGQIVDHFADTQAAKKAAGATRRLDSVGKVLQLHGNNPAGKPVDLSQFRNKVVLIQYWATWCEPCKADHELLKEAQAKYGKNLTIISISLDKDKADLEGYLKKHPLPWNHIFEPGGIDSRLANELGIVTLPTMLLVDQSGKVVNRAIMASEIDREVKALTKQSAAAKDEASEPKTGIRRQKADAKK
ncbi:MAG TPA: thioredoxin-like domain-containing protein [Pirellulales bacterium]|jgi:thiol-disulfide isomerase/thioredoxin|nr:thioredoxin-like domain-containing protein [Pirellulales bacterium]